MKKGIINTGLFLLAFSFMLTSWVTPSAWSKSLDIWFITSFIQTPNKLMQDFVDDFGKKNGVEAKLTYISLKDIDHKTGTLMEAGTGADLVNFNIFGPVLYADKLVDLSDLAKEIDTKHGGFLEVAKRNAVIENKWRAIPFYYFQFLQLYRKDILNQIGENPVSSFPEGMLRLGEKLKKQNPDMIPFGMSLGRGADSETFIWDTIWGFGGRMVKEDGKKIVFNSPETVAAVKFIVDLVNRDYISKGAPGWDDASNNVLFLKGKVAVTHNSPSIWWAAKNAKHELADKIGSAKTPTGPVGTLHSLANVYSWGIPKFAKEPELAKKFILYLFERYNEYLESTEGNSMPTVRNPLKQVPLYSENPIITPASAMVDSLRPMGWPGPVTKAAAEVWSRRIAVDMFSRALNDKLSVEEAVAEAHQKIEAVYNK